MTRSILHYLDPNAADVLYYPMAKSNEKGDEVKGFNRNWVS